MNFGAIIPVYILVGIGFLAVKSRYIQAQSIQPVNMFLVRMIVPVVIFLTIFNTAGQGQWDPQFLLSYGLGSSLTYILAVIILWRLFKIQHGRSALLAMGAAGSNSIMLGFPIAFSLFPDMAERAFSSVLIVESLIIIPFSLLFAEYWGNKDSHFLQTLMKTLRNPIVIAIFAGLILPIFAPNLWPPLHNSLIFMRNAMTGMSLLIVGGILAQIQWKGFEPAMFFVSASKLIMMPLFIVIFFSLLGVNGELRAIGVLFAALSVFGIYANFAEMAGEGRFGASVFFITTLILPVSLWFWMHFAA